MPKIFEVSPYCVFIPEPDSAHVLAIHSTSGLRMRLSVDLMQAITGFLSGSTIPAIIRQFAGSAAELRPALAQLVQRGILVDRAEHERQARQRASANRLGPLELALHRQIDTGGFFPDAIDPSQTPPLTRASALERSSAGRPIIALRRSAKPVHRLYVLDCLAMRHTQRRYAHRAMSRQKLARLLEHAAAASRIVTLPGLGTVSHRPYPSGGARYPLEIHACVYRVATLAPAIYHYDPFGHSLACVDDDLEHLDHLRRVYQTRAGTLPDSGDPHVLLVITAVFERTAWKYRGIPYPLVQQEVGALYQTLYLVATELGLAACPIGGFPEKTISRYVGSDGITEAQVGLFAVGTPGKSGPPWQLVACRIVRPSPFSSRGKGYAIELTYGHGVREIADSSRFAFEFHDGSLRVPALGGRERAVLAPELEATLEPRIRRYQGRRFVALDGGRIAIV